MCKHINDNVLGNWGNRNNGRGKMWGGGRLKQLNLTVLSVKLALNI